MAPLPRLVCFGEALTDLIRVEGKTWHSHDGGAPWNAARALRQLGVDAAFAGAISRDPFGQALWRASEAAGLDLRFIQQHAKPPLLAVVHETDPPQYFFIGSDSADLAFDPALLPAGWRQALQWAHFGGISLTREPLASTLVTLASELKAAGVRISYDPNFRALMDARYDATFERMSRLADVIKVSDEDLRGLFRTADAEAALARLRAWNPQALLMLTRGAQGASLFHGKQHWSTVPPAITVADTVGAGDASLAGLLHSLIARPDASGDVHLRQAVAAGAAACEQAGAASLSLARVEALAQRML